VPNDQEGFVAFFCAAKLCAQYLATYNLYQGGLMYGDAAGEYAGDTEAETRRPTHAGQIVKFHTPQDDEEAKMRYVTLEVHDGDDRPRAHIRAVNSGLSIPPVNVVRLGDLVVVDDAEEQKSNDPLAYAIGTFFRVANDYSDRFKIGGKQKLQKLVGEDIFYDRDGDWYFNTQKITKMSISELRHLTGTVMQQIVRSAGLPDKITTLEDIRLFFVYLYFVDKVGFHPDEDFLEYVDGETGEPSYTKAAARKRNALMEQAFEVAAAADADIYGIAMEVAHPAGEDDSEW
jgi:hypothetical protein